MLPLLKKRDNNMAFAAKVLLLLLPGHKLANDEWHLYLADGTSLLSNYRVRFTPNWFIAYPSCHTCFRHSCLRKNGPRRTETTHEPVPVACFQHQWLTTVFRLISVKIEE
jgi:hypothetical protein